MCENLKLCVTQSVVDGISATGRVTTGSDPIVRTERVCVLAKSALMYHYTIDLVL